MGGEHVKTVSSNKEHNTKIVNNYEYNELNDNVKFNDWYQNHKYSEGLDVKGDYNDFSDITNREGGTIVMNMNGKLMNLASKKHGKHHKKAKKALVMLI